MPSLEIAEALRTIGTSPAPVLGSVVPLLRELVQAEQASAYRVRAPGDGPLELEFVETAGFAASRRAAETFARFIAGATGRFSYYDHAVPEPEQRNLVIRPLEIATPEEVASVPIVRDLFPQVGLAGKDQLRVLLCDGDSLLAWVGGFRSVPFRKEEVAALQAIVPALRERVVLDRQLAEGAFARQALDAALEAIPRAAFLVDAGARVRHANAVGRALLGRASLRDELAACVRGEPSGFELRRVAAPGLPLHYLLVRRSPPGDPTARLELAAQRWNLTGRQLDVLALLVRGLGNKTIADTLRCSPNTVELHVSALLAKMGAENRAGLVARFWTMVE